MLYRAFVGGLNPEVIAAAIQTRRPFDGLSPNIDTLVPINAFDFKARKGSVENSKFASKAVPVIQTLARQSIEQLSGRF